MKIITKKPLKEVILEILEYKERIENHHINFEELQVLLHTLDPFLRDRRSELMEAMSFITSVVDMPKPRRELRVINDSDDKEDSRNGLSHGSKHILKKNNELLSFIDSLPADFTIPYCPEPIDFDGKTFCLIGLPSDINVTNKIIKKHLLGLGAKCVRHGHRSVEYTVVLKYSSSEKWLPFGQAISNAIYRNSLFIYPTKIISEEHFFSEMKRQLHTEISVIK